MSPTPRAARKQEQPHAQTGVGGATGLGKEVASAKPILLGTAQLAAKAASLPVGLGISVP